MNRIIKLVIFFSIFPFLFYAQDKLNVSDENGLRQGKWKILNEGIECTLIYKDNERNGECKCFYQDGSLLTTGRFLKDSLEGKHLELYKNGQIYKEDNYSNGILDGEQKVFNQNEEIIYFANYHLGVLDGIEKLYYKSGKLKVETFYENGRVKKVTCYRRNGKVKKIKNY